MRTAIIGAFLVVAMSAAAAAQPARPRGVAAAAKPALERGFITINAGLQPAAKSFGDSFTFDENVETASVNVRYPVKASAIFDGGVGVRVWKRFGAGVSVSYLTRTGRASIDASIPHPIFFNQPRTVTGQETGLTHNEAAAHVQVLYMLPARRHLRVTLAAGPSAFNVEQTVVTAIHVSDVYPFDTATLASTDTALRTATAIGFNAGADITWMVTRRIGAGALLRFTRATLDLKGANDKSLSVNAGGGQAGLGLRIVF